MVRSAISLPKLWSHGAGPAHPAKTRRIEAPNRDVMSIHFLNYALYAPERVEKLILLCPMGISPPRAIMGIRMIMSQLFPKKRRLMRSVNWALGDNPAVQNFSGEWFLTMMEGVIPRVALPRAVKPVHLQSIEAPVLLFLGTKDNVVGSSKKAERRAAKMEDIKIEILDTGHVPGIEKADVVNSHIIKFLND
jgi:pimeloyl-ACP methyl ester carboxylesterase